MWKPIISFFSSSARQEENLRTAEFIINSNRALMCNLASASKPENDQQLKCFDANRAAIFNAYTTIHHSNPALAIRALLELEKILKPNAQASFWAAAQDHIPTLLRKSTPEIKETVYRYILEHAHKGQIADFMMSNHADFGALITSPPNLRNADLLGTFLSHAQPKAAEFLDTFKPQFEEIYAKALVDKLSLTKRILKACQPFNGKDKHVCPPDYVNAMRDEQIKMLIQRAINIYSRDNADYKQMNNCLQELETLKAGNTHFLGKAKLDKNEKSELQLYLYKLDIPKDEDNNLHRQPTALYILAGKPKAYASPTDSGKISTILATTDLSMVTKAFATLPYNANTKMAVAKLSRAFASPDFIAASSYATNIRYASPTFSIRLHPAFEVVSQLTVQGKGVNLDNVQISQAPQYRDIFPIKHSEPREIQ